MSGLQKLSLVLSLAVVSASAYAGDAQPRPDSASGVADVTLAADSGLSGQYLDGAGQPIDGAMVTLTHRNSVIGSTTTDARGAYHFPQVRQGVYQLTTGTQTQTIRVWEPRLAPPAAGRMLTTVRSDQIVRGQFAAIGASTIGTVGGVAGVAGAGAGTYAVVETQDAQDDAEEAMAEAAHLREMMHHLMSP